MVIIARLMAALLAAVVLLGALLLFGVAFLLFVTGEGGVAWWLWLVGMLSVAGGALIAHELYQEQERERETK